MNRPSITARLYLGFVGLLVLTLLVLGTAAALWFRHLQSDDLSQFLEAEVRGISYRLEGLVEGLALGGTEAPAEVAGALRSDVRAFLSQRVDRPVAYKTTLVIFDADGGVLARSNGALDLGPPGAVPAAGKIRFDDVEGPGPAYRVATAAFALGPGGRGTFRVGCLLAGLEGPWASFAVSLAAVLGGCLLVLSVLGAGLISLTLRPVRGMAEAAGRISELNLDGRIPVPPGRDDLSRMAGTLNGLLERLETGHAFQERLVGDLTHQLKTPLTILRGRNELALTNLTDAADLRELVEDNLSDIDAVVNLLNTLLELARLDSRMERLRTAPVDLGRLVADLGAELEPLWLARNLRFETEGATLTVEADAEGLRQMLTNLYDNAWKFAPPGSRILTRWRAEGDQAVVEVENQGPPVPPGDRELIFRRFFRSSSADPGLPGAGLGLSIVLSLAQRQGGGAEAYEPPGGGAGFRVRLPYGSSR